LSELPSPPDAGSRLGGQRRRPSAEPPPLPRSFDGLTLAWLLFAAGVSALWLLIGLVPPISDALNTSEGEFVVDVAGRRTEELTSFLSSLYSVLYTWTVPIVGWGTVIALITFRRFRHVLCFLGSLLVTLAVTYTIEGSAQRPRPFGVVIEGRWEGFAHPSWPVAAAAAVLTGAGLSLVPPGRLRRFAIIGVGVVLVAYAAVETYLGVSHPTDQIMGIVVGVTVPVLAFRLFAPEEVFPVAYGPGGNSAHLDLSGERGRAIREAVDEQLGVEVVEIKPIGSEASKGSTPMRLFTVDRETDDVGPILFAKLLARSHLRSDRWYKLGRTLLYGRLEDEGKFDTVRRLVQQEDYLGLRIAEAGIHVPKTYGVIELTPEREYLLVTSFLDGYQEIGEADLSMAAIDNALGVVRRLWDAGLAHRDIKPGNLMVRDDDVALIDVSVGEVRPSPWRQAVDLANIMLVLALRSDAETVYERALLQFTPTDIGEAFAATRGVTLPSQLREDLKADNRDLIGRFRELAPDYPPISIQHWSWRRLGLIAWVVLVAVVVVSLGVDYLQRVGMLP
jgi:tRNA A-37 threonylcarbamoyl transferase component Bud32/membrane-associated phospholipid phosphatase